MYKFLSLSIVSALITVVTLLNTVSSSSLAYSSMEVAFGAPLSIIVLSLSTFVFVLVILYFSTLILEGYFQVNISKVLQAQMSLAKSLDVVYKQQANSFIDINHNIDKSYETLSANTLLIYKTLKGDKPKVDVPVVIRTLGCDVELLSPKIVLLQGSKVKILDAKVDNDCESGVAIKVRCNKALYWIDGGSIQLAE